MQTRFEFVAATKTWSRTTSSEHADVFSVESYRTPHMDSNTCAQHSTIAGDPTSFERNILSRQGGCCRSYPLRSSKARWTPELYPSSP